MSRQWVPVYQDEQYQGSFVPHGGHSWGPLQARGPHARVIDSRTMQEAFASAHEDSVVFDLPPQYTLFEANDTISSAPSTHATVVSGTQNAHFGDSRQASNHDIQYVTHLGSIPTTQQRLDNSQRSFPRSSTLVPQNSPANAPSSGNNPQQSAFDSSSGTMSMPGIGPSFTEGFDWIRIAARAMRVYPEHVPYLSNPLIQDFHEFNRRMRDVTLGYDDLRKHVLDSESETLKTLFEQFEIALYIAFGNCNTQMR